ncbi:PepSY domain-containing protein [Methanocella sp. MCL-LM]|uniref:PepSY domain-containing protein n=1 Tax=Methanocella sp. MCL-LM TaxID=3412035 RepID=UPI003C70F7A4
MRLNWLSLLPVVLVLALLAMGYIVLAEPAGKPKISKAEAMKIAQARFPAMSMENSSAELSLYRAGNTEKLVWYVDVKTVPGMYYPGVYIAVVNAGEPGIPMSWGGIVTIDAVTGEVLHVNPVG